MVSWVVDHVLQAEAWLVYAVVWITVFAEDALFVGFVVPGETAAIVGGVTASVGHTALWAVVLVVVSAAIIGDSVGYQVGRTLGPRLLGHRRLDGRRAQIDRAQDTLRRRGGSAVFLGRWTAFFRAVMPALAGASRMRYLTFLTWNAVGGLVWGTAVAVAGYFAGQSYQRLEHWLGTGTAIGAAVVVVGVIVVWQVRRHRQVDA
ncbi:conserved membrane hypothetical protein [Nostocoides japonicum T1-X7]|uniref:VTT domain-containing protein n=1 Tax=Nostocoides japonicum T1-X7 TaxID=1194083 RepID=A0A077LU39_9MICO|nr:conserved membrane hypothetical protein [Tetrasphaera japonica T1-X7]